MIARTHIDTFTGFFGQGGATLFGQYLKLREEFGELSGNFAKGRWYGY